MKLTKQESNKTNAKFSLSADTDELNKHRELAIASLSGSVKVPGFRPGKAPSEMLLKYTDQNELNNAFLNSAVNELYSQAIETTGIRAVGEPKISITKFVPFSTLEIHVEVPIIKEVKLPNYKTLGLKKSDTKVSKEQLDLNLKELRKRSATFKPVKRPAKKGDQAVIDFDGTDPKTKAKIPQASSTDYKLFIGDNTLIPGFEDNLIGLTIQNEKSFDLVFPKDYAEKSFASRKVTFKVKLKELNSAVLPDLDDKFAASVGPFTKLDELKSELTRQLQAENGRQASLEIDNQILNKLAENTKVELSDELINSELAALTAEAKRSAINRGQTWTELLDSIGKSEDDYLKELKSLATTRIKGGLAVGEIATKENIEISADELEQHIDKLKAQYADSGMQAELDKPDNRRELAMRLLTSKVLDFIKNNQTKTTK